MCMETPNSNLLGTIKPSESQKGKFKFRVIDTRTNKDVTHDEYDIALNEEWARELLYCDMEGWGLVLSRDFDEPQLILLDECGKYEWAPDYYKIEFIIEVPTPDLNVEIQGVKLDVYETGVDPTKV